MLELTIKLKLQHQHIDCLKFLFHQLKRKINTQTHDFIGLVKSYDEEKGLAWVEQRNHFKLGQTVEFLQPKGHLVRYTIDRIVGEDGQELDAARHAQQFVGLAVPERLEPYSMMRRQVKSHV